MKILDLELKRVPFKNFVPMLIALAILWGVYYLYARNAQFQPSSMFVATTMQVLIAYLVGCGNKLSNNWKMTVPFVTIILVALAISLYVGVMILDKYWYVYFG